MDARRRSGEGEANPLGSNLQANAVLDGLDVVRGSWEQAFTKVQSRAARKFSDASRHEINYLLCWALDRMAPPRAHSGA